MFRQSIVHGEQRERPDNWLATPTPWQVARPDEACAVPLFSYVEHGTDRDNHFNLMWLGWQLIVGVPCDMPIAGHGGETVNVLRLYPARASDAFAMPIFNDGDYLRAVEAKMRGELGTFSWLYDAILDHAHCFHLADLGSYLDAQTPGTHTAILNVARMG